MLSTHSARVLRMLVKPLLRTMSLRQCVSAHHICFDVWEVMLVVWLCCA